MRDCLRDLWNNMCKHTNMYIIGFPEEGERYIGVENLFSEIMTENFS